MRIILWLLLLCAFNLRAQTNLEVLSTLQGDYTNATIIRTNAAYIVVSHLDGVTKVPMTNLPPSLQKRFGYNPTNAAAALAQEKKKADEARAAALARQKYLASLVGQSQPVRCLAIIDGFGQCQISTSNGTSRAYVLGLPSRINSFMSALAALKSGIETQTEYSKRLDRQAKRADANAPVKARGNVNYVNAAMAERRRANNLSLDADDAAAKLAEMKKQFEQMTSQAAEATTFQAYPTGILDNGLPRWQAVQ
jgi:hypothetical protein